MELIKEKWQSWRKVALYAALSISIIIGLLILLRLTLGVNFILGEEIVIRLEPEQTSLLLHHGERKNVTILFSAQSPVFCKARCSYVFLDKSKRMELDSENLTLLLGQKIERTYTLLASRTGRGQDIYSFEARCQNERTFLCPSSQKTTFRSSPIILNYDLSDEEKILKQQSQEELLLILKLANEADGRLKAQSLRLSALDRIKKEDLSIRLIEWEDNLSKQVLKIEGLRTLWANEEYRKLSDGLDEDLEASLAILDQGTASLASQISQRIKAHNSIASSLEEHVEEAGALIPLYALSRDKDEPGIAASILAYFHDANQTAEDLRALEFDDYQMMENKTRRLDAELESIGNQSLMLRSSERARSEYLIASEYDYLCALQSEFNGTRQGCDAEGTMESVHAEYRAEIGKGIEWSMVPQGMCGDFEQLENDMEEARNKAVLQIVDRNISFSGSLEFKDEAKAYAMQLRHSLQEQYLESLALINDSLFSGIIPIPSLQNSSQETNISLVKAAYLLSRLEPSDESADHFSSRCDRAPIPILLSKEGLDEVNESENDSAVSSIITSLSDNPAICCIFGECAPCCIDASCSSIEESFPVIFLHGHALTSSSSPSYSLDAFNLIQNELEAQGYLNAGIVTPTTVSGVKGEWGLSGRPISVKASYYLDAYREGKGYVLVPAKSENIDTYALRLRDIIEVVKIQTGKDRVNIVAHSMGGLVARRYLQIFGDNDVNKLIMIATPDHGIAGKVNEYCPLFGEKKECLDMQKGSLFLNRLNDPQKQPKSVRMYTVAGIGCDPGNDQGDGVVSWQSVHLDEAYQYNISGLCEGFLGEQLHTELLDISEYPMTMEIIRLILEG